MNRHLTKNIYTCQMKRCSTSYITRKLHISTIRYHHATIRMVTTQTLTTPNGGQEAEQQNLSRECKITQDFLTKLSIGFPGGISGRELACQYGRCERLRFHPWVKKMPWRRAWQPVQFFCLENSMDRGAWQATVQRVAKSQTRLKQFSMYTCEHKFTIQSSNSNLKGSHE